MEMNKHTKAFLEIWKDSISIGEKLYDLEKEYEGDALMVIEIGHCLQTIQVAGHLAFKLADQVKREK